METRLTHIFLLTYLNTRFFSQAVVARSSIPSLHTLTEDEQLLKESGNFLSINTRPPQVPVGEGTVGEKKQKRVALQKANPTHESY